MSPLVLLPHFEQSSFEGKHKSWHSPSGWSLRWSHTEMLNLGWEGWQSHLRRKKKREKAVRETNETVKTVFNKKWRLQKLQLTYDNSNFKKISSKRTNIHTHDVPQTFWADIWEGHFDNSTLLLQNCTGAFDCVWKNWQKRTYWRFLLSLYVHSCYQENKPPEKRLNPFQWIQT